MFARFCIDSLSIFCRCLLVSLLILFLCSVRVVSVLLRVFTGSSTSPLCASGFIHPQVVPLIVSSHLLNVPLIVSWKNRIICNSKCTMIDNTIIISQLDLEKLLSVFCRFSVVFLSIIRHFSVDVCMFFWWYSVFVLAVLLYVFTGSSIRSLFGTGLIHPQVVSLIVSSHLLNVWFIVSWLNRILCNKLVQ